MDSIKYHIKGRFTHRRHDTTRQHATRHQGTTTFNFGATPFTTRLCDQFTDHYKLYDNFMVHAHLIITRSFHKRIMLQQVKIRIERMETFPHNI